METKGKVMKKESKAAEFISVRLTQDLRRHILNKIIGAAFDERLEALEQKRFDFSEKVYKDFYSKKIREQMESLPKGWLPESDYAFFQFGSDSSGYCRRSFRKPVRWLAKDAESRGAKKVYDLNHVLTLEHSDLHSEAEALKEKRQNSWREAEAILESVNTTKALKQAWPELAPIVQQFEPTEKKASTALVPILTELNKTLGLKAA